MNFQARFGAAQTDVGYQFYDSTGALLGNRTTTGISASPEAGTYCAPNVTPPVGAVGIFWDTDEGAEASELLAVYNGPSAEAIADAVVSENSDELTAIQSAVDAANLAIAALPVPDDYSDELAAIQSAVDAANTTLADAETILLASPYTPAEQPVLIIPVPDPNAELSVVYVFTENIINVPRAGIVLKFRLLARTARSERILETAPVSSPPTDANGYTQITLQRNQEYRVHCKALGLVKTFTPTTETFDLLTII
jgi:hypothetical protein